MLEIHDGIIFDFYPGLPYMRTSSNSTFNSFSCSFYSKAPFPYLIPRPLFQDPIPVSHSQALPPYPHSKSVIPTLKFRQCMLCHTVSTDSWAAVWEDGWCVMLYSSLVIASRVKRSWISLVSSDAAYSSLVICFDCNIHDSLLSIPLASCWYVTWIGQLLVWCS